ncbi:2OG-Fe(II) oxygenase family protein [Streptomyces angustmyceticus]|uniref:2OG-Fe(II) oxygenase family protein n=1 Tax=Streptomyces angustmyceticus TaxID=285578 RepID=UPI0037F6BDC8
MTTTTAVQGPPLRLPIAQLTDEDVDFTTPDGWEQALRLGAFLLPVPDDLDTGPGLRLCRNFYLDADGGPDARYRGHRTLGHSASKLGYEDRPDQVEQLQIESAHWDTYFPEDVVGLLRRMRELTLTALNSCLAASGVPERDWDTVTGGARQETGWCYTTVNHYRAGLSRDHGIVEHTDSGFITVIYADQQGYEILDGDRWRPVEVPPRHFVVNLGDAAEILTTHLPRPAGAVIHRVPPRSAPAAGGDRSSFTVYMGPRMDMLLYRYGTDGELGAYQGFRDYSVEKSKKLGYEFHSRI